ncbi:MAG: sugar ABC transporter ATP-binding protein [Thermoleophilia bacterium]
MAEPIFAVRDVTRRFDAVVALDRVSIDFHAGAVHALLGENGSGKSTTVRVLTGALAPDDGAVLVEGAPRRFGSPRGAIAAGIAAAYQESALVPHLSVAENVVLGHERSRWGVLRPGALAAARPWLEMVGLDVPPRRRVRGLSVAEQQLVAIAKALSLEARMLILDEPTAALNGAEVEHLLGLVARLRDRGLAIVYITHRLAEVARIADTVTVLKDGRVVTTRPSAGLGEAEIVPLMVGRAVEQLYPELPQRGDEIVLEAEDLASRDGSVAVDRFAVRAGEVVGISGLEGSGRATLARMLAGVEPGARGRLVVIGRHLPRPTPARALRRGLGFVPPDRRRQAIVPTFSVGRSITLASLRSLGRLAVISPRAERSRARTFIDRFAIKAAGVRAPIRTLSGGNQQKVVLSRVLCAGTRVVVCDEPTAGVDIGARGEIYRALADLAADGFGVVVSSSDMLELIGLCHRIAVMREGRLAAEMDAADASEESLMRAQLPDARAA